MSITVGDPTATGEFQVSGSVSAASSMSGDFSASSLGTSQTPGLIISDTGVVTELSVTISSDLTVQGLGISASVNDLQLVYEVDPSSIYNGDFLIEQGTVTISTSAGDTSFAATFGSVSGSVTNPGLVLDDGSLANLYATISSNLWSRASR